MPEIQITQYEKVLCELTNMCVEFKPFNTNSYYKIGVHMGFNYTKECYVIMHCFGFNDTEYKFVHWIKTQEELNAFTENNYKQICEELKLKFKKYELARRLKNLKGDFND